MLPRSRSSPRSVPHAVLAVLPAIAAVVIVGSSPALARERPRVRACGQVATLIAGTGSVKIWALSQVSARRVSCARARVFVRGWERLANEGKLPNAADGRVHKGILVYNQWGRPYRVTGFVCRSLAYYGVWTC
jgi:hypothetical protein